MLRAANGREVPTADLPWLARAVRECPGGRIREAIHYCCCSL